MWLKVCAALVGSTVVLGGLTRLTESGLSMTDWRPLGSLPPIGDEAWEAEFARYKTFPEYSAVHADLDVDGFKRIYAFEYTHRMLGRVIGAAYALPLAYFAARGTIARGVASLAGPRGAGLARARSPMGALVGIGALIGGQGLLGWYMVRSGLEVDPASGEVPRVSQYRLASHLGLAFTIYGAMLWTLLSLPPATPLRLADGALPALDASALRALRRLRFAAPVCVALTGATVLSGALVAGLDAGLIYNEYPLMGGSFVPPEFLELSPRWKNFLENPATTQFDHRWLGASTMLSCLATFAAARAVPRAVLGPAARRALHALAGMSAVQVGLGIAALLNHVPVALGSAHQTGALALFSFAVWALKEVRRLPK
jgi:cytochrome c oxidase assembly protein subunit 15